ncbi:MAG: hypothetical protein Q8N13_22560 [Acidovorax sp.]|nr:hypothetical protein [Acidovorax sp.]
MWKDLLPWLAPAFTLVGWFIVNGQNNERERRKEARAAADRCKTLAREVTQLGYNYWLGQGSVAPWQIKAQLEELEVEITRFPADKGRNKLIDRHIDLVEAVTGLDFESATMKPRPVGHAIYREMAIARQRLLSEIEQQFSAHFQ